MLGSRGQRWSYHPVQLNDYVHCWLCPSTRRPDIVSSRFVSPATGLSAWHVVRTRYMLRTWVSESMKKQETLQFSHSYPVVSVWTLFLGILLMVFCLHSGTLIVLKHPYPRKVEEPSIYESVRVHTAMQTGRTENDLVPTAPSVSGRQSTHRAHCLKAVTVTHF